MASSAHSTRGNESIHRVTAVVMVAKDVDRLNGSQEGRGDRSSITANPDPVRAVVGAVAAVRQPRNDN
jgi:hypothetical protein